MIYDLIIRNLSKRRRKLRKQRRRRRPSPYSDFCKMDLVIMRMIKDLLRYLSLDCSSVCYALMESLRRRNSSLLLLLSHWSSWENDWRLLKGKFWNNFYCSINFVIYFYQFFDTNLIDCYSVSLLIIIINQHCQLLLFIIHKLNGARH